MLHSSISHRESCAGDPTFLPSSPLSLRFNFLSGSARVSYLKKMTAGLDMSLDDIIRSSRSSRSGPARSRGRRTGPGPSRRLRNPNPYRAAPYAALQVRESTTFQAADSRHHPLAGQGPAVETATKIYVSNLDYGVSNDDIKELFSEVGVLKRYGIHYDRNGLSQGTAEVVFSQRSEALAAFKRYSNVRLDGKPMQIELMGANIVSPPAPPQLTAPLGNFTGASRWGQGRGGPVRRPLGSDGRALGRDRGRSRGGRTGKISAEDLDADLDKYHSEAMQVHSRHAPTVID